MGAAGFFGLLLLGCGPLATVFLFSIAPASFLVLLTLGSACFWLVTLFVISSLFRAWAPLAPEAGPYVGLLLVAVLIQELARMGVWRFHRQAGVAVVTCVWGAPMSMRVLNRIAQEQHDAPLSVADRFALALSYGFSHGAAHSAFFFLSWLPLSLDSGTVYNPRCPRLSYFTVGALSTLGMAAVLTGGMVLFFDALDRRRPRAALLAPATHAAAALLTLVNFTQGGCLVTVPLLLAGGAGVAAAAGRVCAPAAAVEAAAGEALVQQEGQRAAPVLAAV
ncbi:hypothetical protein ABPG75_005487 [Micractinium tetrahymenae]